MNLLSQKKLYFLAIKQIVDDELYKDKAIIDLLEEMLNEDSSGMFKEIIEFILDIATKTYKCTVCGSYLNMSICQYTMCHKCYTVHKVDKKFNVVKICIFCSLFRTNKCILKIDQTMLPDNDIIDFNRGK